MEKNKLNPRFIEITSENYHEVVNDPSKTVVVIYVAKWCEKSRETIIHYDRALNLVKIMPSFGKWNDLIIAHFDVSENEIEGLDIQGLPFFHIFPSGSSNKTPVEYHSRSREPRLLLQEMISNYGFEEIDSSIIYGAKYDL